MSAKSEPHHLDEILNQYQGLLVALKLAAYATDAMRVLRILETNAEISPSLEHAIRSACPDWRNPGSIYDPAELISTGLMHVVEATRSLFNELAMLAGSDIPFEPSTLHGALAKHADLS